ncbi:MAG: beta-ketoacyl synthase [Bacteroidetes bacterium]|nr:beta-ketoacyl synthase [Bacteroidota bacterium]
MKHAEKHTRLELLSLLSIQDVLQQSGINAGDKDLGLIYTTTKGNIDLLEGDHPGIDPNRVYLPVFANYLKQQLGLVNIPLVVSNACISGLLGIIMAQRFIEQKRCRHVIVCGGDILSEFTLSGFKSFNALSPEPCKPFDANRTGINLGEAVSSILITADETLAGHEKTQLVRGASANDANHISGPSRTGDGLLQAIQQTLVAGETLPGFISAHGTATPYNDEMESIAFERAGLTTMPVNSLKGYYGHTLGAAGVLETVISLMALHRQTFIKSAGYESKGVSGQIQLIDKTSPGTISSFLKTASGFGGCNGAALFMKA